MKVKDRFALVILLIVACLMVSDLFFHPGRSITYDGHVHMTTMVQFYNALVDGEFPARWANGFANYGLPIPVVAQQTTSYLGAAFQFITHNAVQSYNLVVAVAVIFSSLFFYIFLRYHFDVAYALAGAVLFNFAPYRIHNIFMRGAVPELFGTVFFPVVLVGLYQTIKLKSKSGSVWIILGVTFLALSHPMMLILSSFLLGPYALYLLWQEKWNLYLVMKLAICGALGLLLAGYYLLPLALEIKYFTYGNTPNHFTFNNPLSFPDSFIEDWSYFGNGHPGPRGDALTIGTIETTILILALVWLGVTWKKSKKAAKDLVPWGITLILAFFLMTSASIPLYTQFPFLNNIQYPWRNLAEISFIIPFILAWVLAQLKKPWLAFAVILLVLLIRLPQSYGKNFMVYDLAQYDFTTANLHTDNMNTVWMDSSINYPDKQKQYGVIGGKAEVEVIALKNASREYTVHASGEARLIDYTFYFPGWHVYVDGQETTIEYQDVNHRGIITYMVPDGKHNIRITFENTKVRLAGLLLTIIGIIATVVYVNIDKIAVLKKFRTYL